MPAAVIPFGPSRKENPAAGRSRSAHWSLLEIAPPGGETIPCGILLVDDATDELTLRCRPAAELDNLAELEEQAADILECLEADLRQKAGEQGGAALLGALEQTLSNFLRIGDRAAIVYEGSARGAVDRLYRRFVDASVRPFVTHLPYYGLRAAATRFGESGAFGEAAGDDAEWLPVHGARAGKAGKILSPDLFVARVVGGSMEPLIPDDSLCIFRAGVTGTRQGRYLLIERFGETDFASRYTVKRYTSVKQSRPSRDSNADAGADADVHADSAWEHARIRLEPRNPEFEAFDLGPDEFRVIAEFVEVLGPAADLL